MVTGEGFGTLNQISQLELTDCDLRSLPEELSSLVKLEQLMLEVRRKGEEGSQREGSGLRRRREAGRHAFHLEGLAATEGRGREG